MRQDLFRLTRFFRGQALRSAVPSFRRSALPPFRRQRLLRPWYGAVLVWCTPSRILTCQRLIAARRRLYGRHWAGPTPGPHPIGIEMVLVQGPGVHVHAILEGGICQRAIAPLKDELGRRALVEGHLGRIGSGIVDPGHLVGTSSGGGQPLKPNPALVAPPCERSYSGHDGRGGRRRALSRRRQPLSAGALDAECSWREHSSWPRPAPGSWPCGIWPRDPALQHRDLPM